MRKSELKSDLVAKLVSWLAGKNKLCKKKKKKKKSPIWLATTNLRLCILTHDRCYGGLVTGEGVNVGGGAHVPDTGGWVPAAGYKHIEVGVEGDVVASAEMAMVMPYNLHKKWYLTSKGLDS